METKLTTIILTASVRIEAATDADIEKVRSNLIGILASAENNGAITQGCEDETFLVSNEVEAEAEEEDV